MQQILTAVEAVGGHVIGWADDWEVSGAVDPMTRPKLGPWLRDERGPYAGIVGASVDRIGRNVVDVLNTGYRMRDTGKLLITYGHDGPWNLDDPNDENMFTAQAWGAQMELRAIQKRNREDTVRAREAGEKKNAHAYGYRFVRLVPTGKVHHVEIDPMAAGILRDVAERILACEDGSITVNTEATRLTRAGVLSPADHRSVMYGRAPKGRPWRPKSLYDMLINEAALGYLMHNDRPVVREVMDATTGETTTQKIRIAPPLWDAAIRQALIEKMAPKRSGSRAPKGVSMLTGRAFCGNCGQRLYMSGRRDEGMAWGCTGRTRGLAVSAECKPAPSIGVTQLNALVEEYFLREFGPTPQYRQVFDPGTGHAARIAELETDLGRLREDRQAGLYDRDTDAAWYRAQYSRLAQEIDTLKAQPERPAGMVWVPTGKSVADLWHDAADANARRDLLASYGVKAMLYPRGTRQRVWIHSLDPAVEADAREQSWKQAQEETDTAFLARLQAAQETEPDWEEIARQDEADEAAQEQQAEETEPDRAELGDDAEPADEDDDRAPDYA